MNQSKGAAFYPNRFNEVAKIFSYVSGKSFDESVDLILTTNVGKGLVKNDPYTLYEQATENVWAMARELEAKAPEMRAKFTVERIVEAYARQGRGAFPTTRTVFHSADVLKETQKRLLRERRKASLCAWKQNWANAKTEQKGAI